MSGEGDVTRTRPPRETFLEEFKDAVSPRSLLLVAGVALLCLGFTASYLAAFHKPTPHRLPVTVVAPAPVAARFADARAPRQPAR